MASSRVASSAWESMIKTERQRWWPLVRVMMPTSLVAGVGPSGLLLEVPVLCAAMVFGGRGAFVRWGAGVSPSGLLLEVPVLCATMVFAGRRPLMRWGPVVTPVIHWRSSAVLAG